MLDEHPVRLEESGRPSSRTTTIVCAAIFGVVAGIATTATRRNSGDWAFFELMAKYLTGSDGLKIFAYRHNLQSGPVALVAVRGISALGGSAVREVVFALLGVSTLAMITRLRSRVVDPARLFEPSLVIGGIVVMLWWGYLRSWGHVDDALVIVIAAAALLLIKTDRRLAAAVLIGVALAIKPWSIFMLPITFSRADWRERRLAPPLLSIFVGVILWSPFLIADPNSLKSMRPAILLAPDSVLRLFGVHDQNLPAALRMGQLLLSLGVVALAVWRDRPYGALLAGVAVRLALDPGTWNYYTATFVFAALIWDLCESKRRLPWATIVASALVLPDWVTAVSSTGHAVLRLTACVGALVVVFVPAVRSTTDLSEPVRSSDRSRPTPDRSAFG